MNSWKLVFSFFGQAPTSPEKVFHHYLFQNAESDNLSPEYPAEALVKKKKSYYFPDSALEAHISDL